MEDIDEFSAAKWAQKTFGEVVLGDKRRTKRAVALATTLAQNPGGWLPLQTGSFAQLKACNGYLVHPASILKGMRKVPIQPTSARSPGWLDLTGLFRTCLKSQPVCQYIVSYRHGILSLSMLKM